MLINRRAESVIIRNGASSILGNSRSASIWRQTEPNVWWNWNPDDDEEHSVLGGEICIRVNARSECGLPIVHDLYKP
jgi:hypothetical protein